jgi:hypothetical protein
VRLCLARKAAIIVSRESLKLRPGEKFEFRSPRRPHLPLGGAPGTVLIRPCNSSRGRADYVLASGRSGARGSCAGKVPGSIGHGRTLRLRPSSAARTCACSKERALGSRISTGPLPTAPASRFGRHHRLQPHHRAGHAWQRLDRRLPRLAQHDRRAGATARDCRGSGGSESLVDPDPRRTGRSASA